MNRRRRQGFGNMSAAGCITRIGIEYARLMKDSEETDTAQFGVAAIVKNDSICELEDFLMDRYGMFVSAVSYCGSLKGNIELQISRDKKDGDDDNCVCTFKFIRDNLLALKES